MHLNEWHQLLLEWIKNRENDEKNHFFKCYLNPQMIIQVPYAVKYPAEEYNRIVREKKGGKKHG